MRMTSLLLAASIGAIGASPTFAANPPAPPSPIAGPKSATDLAARGEYLSQVAHCNACHTADNGAAFAGNRPMGTPFGTLYTSNITPDPTTGIGNWSEKDFEGALRRGIGKGHEYLYPAMPYIDFTKVTDDDIHALYAYFRTVKPVRQAVHKNDMTFPFNVRLGIAGWQAVFLKQGRYVPDQTQSAEWNRGAYLVKGLTHCEACHTPMNVAMAPKKGRELQGNVIDHWFAPDISGGRYSGIRDWSTAQLVTYLKTGHNDKNEAVVGPMQDTVDLGTSHLTDADLSAIAIYLKNQPPEKPDPQPSKPRPLTVAERNNGKTLFTNNCQSCHGADGKGIAGIAPALAGAASVAGKEPDTAIRAVLQGFTPDGPWGVMPSFSEVLSVQDVSDVVNYVRTSWGNSGAGRVSPSQVMRLAGFSDLGNPAVESALVCPSAPAAALDATTLSQVKALADNAEPQEATNKLVAGYRSRHPKVPATDIVTVISGAYCRDVMAASPGTLAERQKRYVAFTGHVAQAVAGAK